MNHFIRLLSPPLLLLLLLGWGQRATAQTTLTAGDIVFLEIQTDTPDGFIWATLVDMDAGTSINFSDIGYRNSDGYAGANEGGVIVWTATANISAGTVVKISDAAGTFVTTVGTVSESLITNAAGSSSFGLATSGDQLIAWQDAGTNASLPTSSNVIAGINVASSDWNGTLTNSNGSLDSNTSDLYAGLTDGTDAVAVGQGAGPQDEHDNARFNPALFCSLNNQTRENILAIVNDPSNWLPGAGATANGSPFPDFFSSIAGCGGSSIVVTPAAPVDTTAPIIGCPSNGPIFADANCQAVLPDFTVNASVSDNVGVVSVSQSPAPGTVISSTTSITLTATDAAGNSASCTFQRAFADTINPVLTSCPTSPVVLQAGANGFVAVGDLTGLVSATDNCTANPIIQQLSQPFLQIDSDTVIVLRARDGANNFSANCSIQVIVQQPVATPTAICNPVTLTLSGGTADIADAEIVLADGDADFNNVQGNNGWTYGSYPAFNSGSFAQLPNYNGTSNQWEGTQPFATPFIDQFGGHPGVSNLAWAVRRWTSNYTGIVELSGDFFDRDGNCGDGAHVRIFRNGTQIYEFLNIPVGFSNRVFYGFEVYVEAGDQIDFVIDPKFDAGCDATTFTANVSRNPFYSASLTPAGFGSVSVSPSSFTCTDAGTNTVSLLVIDANGAVDTCSALVTVTGGSDTTNVFTQSCNPGDVGVSFQTFTNQFGCDSLVITTTTLLPSDSTAVFATTCDPGNVGVSLQTFTNQFGCDSLVVTTTTLLPSDTTNVFASSCNPGDVGVSFQTFANQFGCDSLVITTTTLLPSDTTNVFATSCDPGNVGVGLQTFTNQFGCDSLVITTTTLLPNAVTDLNDLTPSACTGVPVDLTSFEGSLTSATGAFSYSAGAPPSPVSELFFSEYVEGSGFVKYVEIFNGTGSTVDLSNYRVELYNNGASSATSTFVLSGMLNDGDVVVLANPSATGYAGAVLSTGTVNFNGDDAFALRRISDLTLVDVFGVIGEDPGSQWNVNGVETQNQTLRRKSSVFQGIIPTSGFPELDDEWTEFPINTLSGLGSHTVDAPVGGGPIANPMSFFPEDGQVVEVGFTNTQGTCSAMGTITFTVNPTDTVYVDQVVCSVSDVGTNTLFLTNQFGCDSFVVITSTLDVEGPMVVCQPVTVALDSTKSATITVADVDGGTTDGCGIASLNIDRNTFGCDDLKPDTAVDASGLFFSEYVEGSGFVKYVEIFNGTGSTVDLSNYQVELYSNGASSASSSFMLSGMLANGAVAVLANPSATGYTGAVISTGTVNFNGDDAFALRRISDNMLVDVFGVIGEDPGSEWNVNGVETSNHTLRRQSSVSGGIIPASGFPELDDEWTEFPINTLDGLGMHTMDGFFQGVPVVLTATDSAGNTASCTTLVTVLDPMDFCGCNIALDSVAQMDETCDGAEDGVITVYATGADAIEYSIDGGLTYQGSNVFDNLPMGPYYVMVRDAAKPVDCLSDSILVQIVPGIAVPTFSTLAQHGSCQGAFDGSIEVTPNSGVAPYLYSIDGGGFVMGGEPFTFTNVAAGDHFIRVKDSTGCVSEPVEVITTATLPPTFKVEGIFDASDSTSQDGRLRITPLSGEAPFMYSIDGGMTYLPGAAPKGWANLNPGCYEIRIQDANGCESTSRTFCINDLSFCPSRSSINRKIKKNASRSNTELRNVCEGESFMQWYKLRYIGGGESMRIDWSLDEITGKINERGTYDGSVPAPDAITGSDGPFGNGNYTFTAGGGILGLEDLAERSDNLIFGINPVLLVNGAECYADPFEYKAIVYPTPEVVLDNASQPGQTLRINSGDDPNGTVSVNSPVSIAERKNLLQYDLFIAANPAIAELSSDVSVMGVGSDANNNDYDGFTALASVGINSFTNLTGMPITLSIEITPRLIPADSKASVCAGMTQTIDLIVLPQSSSRSANELLLDPASRQALREQYTAYPNPVHDWLTVQLPSNLEVIHRLELTDLRGRVISRELMSAEQQEARLSVSELSEGMYLLRVYTQEGLMTVIKIVRE